jgi:phosphonate transport system substrate-binding protein
MDSETSSRFSFAGMRHNSVLCRIFVELLAQSMIIMLLWQVPCAFADQDHNSQKIFRLVISQTVLDDTDPRDVKIAMDLWARELSRPLDVKKYKVHISKNLEEMRDIIRKGDLDLVTFSSLEYLKLQGEAKTVPILVGANNVGESREYLVLVRKNSGIKKVKELRGKTITLLSEKKNSMGNLWLDILLMREGVSGRDAFFRYVTESASYSRAIMAVFFDKVDAAVVTRGAYDTANALNPQLNRRLSIIEKSQTLAGNISCILPSTSKKFRGMIEDVGMHLHESPTGQQVLMLFKLDRIVPFQPSYLTGLEDLLLERDRLLEKKTKRK